MIIYTCGMIEQKIDADRIEADPNSAFVKLYKNSVIMAVIYPMPGSSFVFGEAKKGNSATA